MPAGEARFLDKNRSWLSFQQLTVLRAIARCRTAALGGHLDSCSGCGRQAISYNSCRNRHCPKCQTQARQRWLAAREQEVLGVPYFHVVFSPDDGASEQTLKTAVMWPARVVYAKAAFGGPAAVLRYLGRYTHRVAISNHRLISHEGDQVTFRWKITLTETNNG